MSHIGKKIINIPSGLNIKYNKNLLEAEGPLGYKSITLPDFIEIKWLGAPINQMLLSMKGSDLKKKEMKYQKSLWGTYRTLINHLFQGIKTGFSMKLNLIGVGYRAHLENKNTLVLKLGYSHLVRYKIPEGAQIQCIQPTILLITGNDKQKVNQIAAVIRSFRKPEPYKGKGIRYENEIIKLKEGKRT